MTTDLSPELIGLLESKLDTYEKVELVLALRAAGAPMTMTDLAMELQVGRDALRRVADEVVASGMIDSVPEDSLHYRPGEWDSVLDEAAHVFAKETNKLLRALTRIGMERIRGLAARTFADAFRIRKKGG